MTHVSFELNAIAQLSALRIVDCLVEGTLITIFAGLMLRAARLQSSSVRFAVWFSALVAIAALPFLGGASWSHGARIPADALSTPAITVPGSWALYLFGTWAVIAGWALLGVGQGLWHLHVLRRSCVPIDSAMIDARLQETLERNRSTRPVALCTSDRVHVPTAIGLVKPAVVLPRWVMQELSSDELNQILLHELAHLRRWDDWTNLTQKVVKALFFFHPAVWWIEKRVSLEREMACDDAVLAETASPRAYAECLAHLAEKTLIQRSMALAQAALGRIRQTSLRVAQILDANRPTGTAHAWKPAVSLVAAFAIACVLGISRAPRLIAFHDSGTSRIAAPTIASVSSNVWSGRLSTVIPFKDVAASKATSERPVRIAQARLNVRRTHSSLNSAVLAVAMQSPPAESGTGSIRLTNVRLTNAYATPVAFTETFFVVVEGRDNGYPGQPVYQIQLWRVMVLHPVADSNSTRIHPRQT